MKHLFVPYPLALLAKQKGFKEPCLAGFGPYLRLITEEEYYYADIKVQAPTHQQLIDWFREEHAIDFLLRKDYGEYVFEIHYSEEFKEVGDKNYYESLNKGIEQAFKLI